MMARFYQTDHLLIQWPRPGHLKWLVSFNLWGWAFTGTSRWLPLAALRAGWNGLVYWWWSDPSGGKDA